MIGCAEPGTNVHRAVAWLATCLQDTNVSVSTRSAEALGTLQQGPGIAIPALIGRLQAKEAPLRIACAMALGKFGTNAQAATPALLTMIASSDSTERSCASNALQRIAPQALSDAKH